MSQNPKKEAECKEKAGQDGHKEEHKQAASDGRDEKIKELTDIAQRLQADFENFKKRSDKEHQNQLRLGKALVIKSLLPTLDTFEQALKQNPNDEGLKLVHQQLMTALRSEGLKEIATNGKLDPYRHECLGEECSPEEKGMITEEIRKGYMLDDYVIRHSLVKVSSGKQQQKEA